MKTIKSNSFWYRNSTNQPLLINYILLTETKTVLLYRGEIEDYTFRMKHPYTGVSEDIVIYKSLDEAKENGALTLIEIFDVEPYRVPAF